MSAFPAFPGKGKCATGLSLSRFTGKGKRNYRSFPFPGLGFHSDFGLEGKGKCATGLSLPLVVAAFWREGRKPIVLRTTTFPSLTGTSRGKKAADAIAATSFPFVTSAQCRKADR